MMMIERTKKSYLVFVKCNSSSDICIILKFWLWLVSGDHVSLAVNFGELQMHGYDNS